VESVPFIGGFDLAYLRNSKISFEGTMNTTTAYLEEDDNKGNESYFGVIPAVIVFLVLVLVVFVRGKMKK